MKSNPPIVGLTRKMGPTGRLPAVPDGIGHYFSMFLKRGRWGVTSPSRSSLAFS